MRLVLLSTPWRPAYLSTSPLCRQTRTHLQCSSRLHQLSAAVAQPELVLCSGKGGVDLLQHDHDVLAVAFRPDGKLLASATLDAQILFWDPDEGELQVPCPRLP